MAGKQIATDKLPNYLKLKVKFPSSGPAEIQLVESQHKLSFEDGDNIEVLCQDSGMRSCWFRCKILRVSEKRLKVQYDDILDCDAPVRSPFTLFLHQLCLIYRNEFLHTVANPDKLDTRCTGRLTVRPRPLEDSSDCSIEVGAAVDAWWPDGWWEGFCSLVRNYSSKYDVFGSGHLHIYFPGKK